jgi:hypothetical protein
VVFITSFLHFVNSTLFQKQHNKIFWKLDTFLSWGKRVRRHVLSWVWQKETVSIIGQPVLSSDWLWLFHQIQLHRCLPTFSPEDKNISSFQNKARFQNQVLLHVIYHQNLMGLKQFHEIWGFTEVTAVFQDVTLRSLVESYLYCKGYYYFHYLGRWRYK